MRIIPLFKPGLGAVAALVTLLGCSGSSSDDGESLDAGLSYASGTDASSATVHADAGNALDGGNALDAAASDAESAQEASVPELDSKAVQHSGFETDAEDWTITGDAQTSSTKPDYSGTGGNPDGLISANDDVTGGVWYYSAPEKYLGDKSALDGGTFSFDIKTTTDANPFDSPDLILTSDSVRIAFDLPMDPGVDWTHYVVPLEAAKWTRLDADAGSLSDAEFVAVLANLTALWIRGEYNSGPDMGALDNVLLQKK